MNTRHFARTIIGASAFVALAATGSAHAQWLVGINSSNEIVRFDAMNPAAAQAETVLGLDAGDRFVGLDLRPSNNTLYGLTLSNRVYTIDQYTGATTFVAALSNPVLNSSQGWGLDFNPVADYAGVASLRLVGSNGGNYAVDVNTGTVNTAVSIAPGYTGVSYINSSPNGAPASTGLYYINTATDSLGFAASNFNNPSIANVGSLGVDALSATGFDVLNNGTAFAALNTDGGSLATVIYRIDLMTGAATSMGEFNGTLSSLTVSAVPEPGTTALILAGLGVVGFSAKRRLGR